MPNHVISCNINTFSFNFHETKKGAKGMNLAEAIEEVDVEEMGEEGVMGGVEEEKEEGIGTGRGKEEEEEEEDRMEEEEEEVSEVKMPND